VFRVLNRPLAAAAVAVAVFTAVLVSPSVALACNGGTSAVNVYKECLQTGGGGRPTDRGPSAGANGTGSTAPHFSGPIANALSRAGKDRAALEELVGSYGLRRHLQASRGDGRAAAPSTVGSAFDLGSGPTVLLIALAGTAFLLLGGSGVRVWRKRHRV
jgi:hypothetical protein